MVWSSKRSAYLLRNIIGREINSIATHFSQNIFSQNYNFFCSILNSTRIGSKYTIWYSLHKFFPDDFRKRRPYRKVDWIILGNQQYKVNFFSKNKWKKKRKNMKMQETEILNRFSPWQNITKSWIRWPGNKNKARLINEIRKFFYHFSERFK